MEKGLTKKHSDILYGIAIILMLYHHLFVIPERIGDNYFSVIDHLFPFAVGSFTIERRIATFGKICVAIYAFISGYGLCRRSSQNVGKEPIKKLVEDYRTTAKRYLNFVLKLFLAACLFVPVGCAIGKESTPFREILLSVMGIRNKFCGSWWYALFYVGMLVYFPLLNFMFSTGFNSKKLECSTKVLVAIFGGD